MSDSETTVHTRVDLCCATVVRVTGDVEEVGPIDVLVARTGWSLAARPALRRDHPVTADDVRAAVARQVELGVDVSFEWVHETTPEMRDAAVEAGLRVSMRPLLVLGGPVAPLAPPGVEVTVLGPADDRFAASRSAVWCGFAGTDDLEPEPMAATIAARADEGLLRVAGAFDGAGAVAGGTAVRGGDAVEVTGVAVLHRARRRGVGAAVAALLAQDARDRGADLVWLSAMDDDVARVYERVGFTRVGWTGEAEPA